MPKILKIARFGNPILREVARNLSIDEIKSDDVQALIRNMHYTLDNKKYGVGMSAVQVGVNAAIIVIGIKPTPNRPELEIVNMVLINPRILETYGRREQMWEGCASCGEGKDILYAKVPRYKKIKLCWLDENGDKHEQIMSGFMAHVAQHEVDHQNGILFVDRVKDTTTYMMSDEYQKRIVQTKN